MVLLRKTCYLYPMLEGVKVETPDIKKTGFRAMGAVWALRAKMMPAVLGVGCKYFGLGWVRLLGFFFFALRAFVFSLLASC